MADFAKRYVVPVLQGAVEADKVLSYSVENAVFAFCDVLSKKGFISPHFLHKEAKEFLEARGSEMGAAAVNFVRCRGKTASKKAECSNKPQWHGYCKVHEDQYTAKVRETDRIKQKQDAVIVHRGHGPDVDFMEGCPGCMKKRAMLLASKENAL